MSRWQLRKWSYDQGTQPETLLEAALHIVRADQAKTLI